MFLFVAVAVAVACVELSLGRVCVLLVLPAESLLLVLRTEIHHARQVRLGQPEPVLGFLVHPQQLVVSLTQRWHEMRRRVVDFKGVQGNFGHPGASA